MGIFVLALLAGIEMQPQEMAAETGEALAVATGGMVLPLMGEAALGWWFLPETDLKTAQVLLVAVAVSISVVPATVKILMGLKVLHHRLGHVILSASVFDDVFGLFLLALLTALVTTGQTPDLPAFLFLLGKVIVFFAITIALGVHVYPRVNRRLKAMKAAAVEFSVLVAVGMAYGALAEGLGMHWVPGVFMAGLFFDEARVAYLEMKLIVHALTMGVLGPLFFASIGLHVDLGGVAQAPLFLFLLLVVAFLGKFVGVGLPAFWVGLGRRESLAVGAGMGARGAVELVVLGIALDAGLFRSVGPPHPVTDTLYSSLVIMALVTTMAAPVLLRRILSGRDNSGV